MSMYEIGEIRQLFGIDLMERLDDVRSHMMHREAPYYILVRTQPEGTTYTTKIITLELHQLPRGPSGKIIPLMATLLFRVDNKKGEMTLMWAFPRDTFDTRILDTYDHVIESVASQAWAMGLPVINS